MPEVLMILGGAWHDFDGYKAAAVPLFEGAGYEVDVTHDFGLTSSLDDSVSAVVVYTSNGGATDKNGVVGVDFTVEQAEALKEYVAAGGGLLGVHSATVMAETGSTLHKLYGGRFVDHPPMFRFAVSPVNVPHPITEGVGQFTVLDEFYLQDVLPGVQILMTAHDRGISHPMVWTRNEGDGRVAYIAPGHDANSWDAPEFQKLSVQALNWVSRK